MLVMAFALVSCSSQAIPAATPTTNSITLKINATSATDTLLTELTLGYRQQNPTITFDMQVATHHTLISQVVQQEIPYILSNHLEPNSNLWAAPIGQDGIAVITHPDVNIGQLSIEQVRDVFQGHVLSWDVLGGQPQPIQVLSREADDSTRIEFERLVMGERRTTASAILVPSTDAMIASIMQTPGSVGYISASAVVPGVAPLAINGVLPTQQEIARNVYPLRTTLFIIGNQEPQDAYRDFIGWVQSPAGQAIVARRNAALLVPQ